MLVLFLIRQKELANKSLFLIRKGAVNSIMQLSKREEKMSPVHKKGTLFSLSVASVKYGVITMLIVMLPS